MQLFGRISKNSGAKMSAPWAFAITASIFMSLSGEAMAASSRDVGVCMPRIIAQSIKDSVFAMKAAQHCKGMPYSIEQAAKNVEAMRCSPQASQIIDRLMNEYDYEYRLILKGDAKLVACTQAAQISFD